MHPGDVIPPELMRRALTRWERELADLGGHDDLLDLDEHSATVLDLGTAHPNGLAGFLAGRLTRLSTLYREPASLQVARSRARQLSLAANRLVDTYGLPGAHLATGMLTWDFPPGRDRVHAPILLRPISLVPRGSGADVDFDLDPADTAWINPALARLLAEEGIDLYGLDGYAVDDDHAVGARRVLDEVRDAVVDLPVRLHDRTLVGTFVDLGPALVADLRSHATPLAEHPTLVALLGRPAKDRGAAPESSTSGLKWSVAAPETVAEPVRCDRAARLDEAQRAVLDAVLTGGDLRVEAAPGSGVTETTAAIVESVTARGGRVLVAAAALDELADLRDRLLDGPHAHTLEAEAALAGHARLHQVDPHWKLSRIQVLRSLVELRASGVPDLPVGQAPHLSHATLSDLIGGRAEVARMLADAADVGAYSSIAVDSPWAQATLADDQAAARALDAVQRLLTSTLPEAAALMAKTAAAVGIPVGDSLTEWVAQVEVLTSTRATLDLFTPAVYDGTTEEMVVATASSAWRSEHGATMSLFDRRRWRREAAALVRPGLQAADLHGGLLRARLEKDLWGRLGATGNPRVPAGLDEAVAACDRVRADIDLLEPVLAGSAVGGGLGDLPVGQLSERLGVLAGAAADLKNLPQRASVIDDLDARGLSPLVAALRAAGSSRDQVAGQLEIAWLHGVLDQMGVPGMAPAEGVAVPRLPRLPDPVARGLTAVTTLSLGIRPPQGDFDTVVLLDAHRIGLAEAMLAIARARQTVVIGDPAGLPPTGLDLSTEAAPPTKPRPSVLSATNGRLNGLRLNRIHRQPAEIAALTRLVSVHGAVDPGWAVGAADPEVTFVHVPGGTVPVVEGETPVPAQEVEQVVALIAEHARLHPDQSLAVLTVNRPQAKQVADVLRSALRRSPDLAGWLTGRTSEPFLITDLWHADAAVRDHVVLALGFAKTPHGRVVHRFGALDTDAGTGLLAVGLGRARRRVSVVSCLWGADLDRDKLSSAGARRLGQLLERIGPGQHPADGDGPGQEQLGGSGTAQSTDIPEAGDPVNGQPLDPPSPDLPGPHPCAAEPGSAESGDAPDPLLGLLATELRSRGLTVRYGVDPASHPDLCVPASKVAVLWDGNPDPATAHRPALVAALRRFGWAVVIVRADDIRVDAGRVAERVNRADVVTPRP